MRGVLRKVRKVSHHIIIIKWIVVVANNIVLQMIRQLKLAMWPTRSLYNIGCIISSSSVFVKHQHDQLENASSLKIASL